MENKENEELNIPFKEMATKLILSFIISLGLVTGPIVLLANLMIYKRYEGLLVLGIVLLTALFIFLAQVIYYTTTYKKFTKGMKKSMVLSTIITIFIGLCVLYALIFFRVI